MVVNKWWFTMVDSKKKYLKQIEVYEKRCIYQIFQLQLEVTSQALHENSKFE